MPLMAGCLALQRLSELVGTGSAVLALDAFEEADDFVRRPADDDARNENMQMGFIYP